MAEGITVRKMSWSYEEENRIGDHIWWVSEVRRFASHYPERKLSYDVNGILIEIHDELVARLAGSEGKKVGNGG